MEGEPATTLLVVPEHFERVAAQEVEQQPSLTWVDSDTGPATALVEDWTGTSQAEVWHDGEVMQEEGVPKDRETTEGEPTGTGADGVQDAGEEYEGAENEAPENEGPENEGPECEGPE